MTTRTRKVKPAKAEVEVINPPAYSQEPGHVGTAGTIAINGIIYGLLPLGRDSRQGYRLYSSRNGNAYDVDTSSGRPQCDCPDQEHQCGTAGRPYCKHSTALIHLRRTGVI
jgi:hypothetical protein